ncbi:ABC transporter ATP-binding protein [Candidatus Hecatella orcuttiae]|jgi:putative ABC transport system ATP-binding protein|uniref:ABC transporter ATP-binding protein n=1 Tax=Candidatus Hecatella orcuttiae TaxID=1935119 RepID=UPI002868213F|nr:ATP-binding cassette domain-containing protein [Candidatus Hecatella orcuttiae]
MSSNSAIRVEHVRKVYDGHGKSFPVFEDVSFEVKKGEFLAVVGPTGCGKTTLINLVAGLDRPQAGNIYVDGVNITKLPEDVVSKLRRRKLGVVFQVSNLIPSLTVYENLELPLVFLGMSRDERRRRVEEVLESFWISNYVHRKVATLSVGENRMVSYARAMISDPEILLLDEPTDFLDPLTEDMMVASFKGKILKGKTLLATTHRRKMAKLADRVINLKKKLP